MTAQANGPDCDDFKHMSLKQLDEWYDANLKRFENKSGEIDFGDDPNGEFYALVEQYERYLDVRDKLLRRKPVTPKQVVADTDAVEATLKTYHAINTRIQNAIKSGTTLDSNDIKLLVDMMKVLNGAQ